jgi:2,4-dienoyl-CoA reductase-like NADH-dependent reductase (Old Yellow Enzyme family)
VPESEGGWTVVRQLRLVFVSLRIMRSSNRQRWQVGPSTIPWSDEYPKPRQLTIEEIKRIQNDFVAAAKRADRIGFDVLEIHGAHGYLISSFNSPIANNRYRRRRPLILSTAAHSVSAVSWRFDS